MTRWMAPWFLVLSVACPDPGEKAGDDDDAPVGDDDETGDDDDDDDDDVQGSELVGSWLVTETQSRDGTTETTSGGGTAYVPTGYTTYDYGEASGDSILVVAEDGSFSAETTGYQPQTGTWSEGAEAESIELDFDGETAYEVSWICRASPPYDELVCDVLSFFYDPAGEKLAVVFLDRQ